MGFLWCFRLGYMRCCDLRLDALNLNADSPKCRSPCVKLAKDQSLSRLDSSPRASPKQTQSFHQIHIQCQKNLSSAPIGVGVIVEISSSGVFAHSTQTSSPKVSSGHTAKSLKSDFVRLEFLNFTHKFFSHHLKQATQQKEPPRSPFIY